MWVYAYNCSGLQKPEVLDSPEAGVPGSCESPSMGARNEPDFSASLDVDLEFTRRLNFICKDLFSKVTHSEVRMRRPPGFPGKIVHQHPDDTAVFKGRRERLWLSRDTWSLTCWAPLAHGTSLFTSGGSE